VGVLTWIVFGLLAGLVARLLTPGNHRIGCIPTLAVGIVGALLGGLIGQVVLGESVQFSSFSLKAFALAVVGAIVLLLALQALRRR
jgi:uncharacterized membrane protein YeaQ/YmgE (transglycosylase-associated protein family)